MRETDLQWLSQRGWIRILRDPDTPIDAVTELEREARVILTESGIAMLGVTLNCVESRAGKRGPHWDGQRHELIFDGRVAKRFRWPAANQESILMAFQEEAWPARIDDPLPPGKAVDPKRRLGDTIKCLNRNHLARLIRFRGDGTGEGILWDRV